MFPDQQLGAGKRPTTAGNKIKVRLNTFLFAKFI
jgi:hypothetical protein